MFNIFLLLGLCLPYSLVPDTILHSPHFGAQFIGAPPTFPCLISGLLHIHFHKILLILGNANIPQQFLFLVVLKFYFSLLGRQDYMSYYNLGNIIHHVHLATHHAVLLLICHDCLYRALNLGNFNQCDQHHGQSCLLGLMDLQDRINTKHSAFYKI